MVVFLANRGRLQNKRLHRRIKNRLQSDARFNAVRLRVSEVSEPGPYRVVAQTDPQTYLSDDEYPVTTARIEIGFDVTSSTNPEPYWFNWIEPARNFLLGWHQDDTHPEYGPVHLQVDESDQTKTQQSAEFIDAHPMAVTEARLDQLASTISAVEWQNGIPLGID